MEQSGSSLAHNPISYSFQAADSFNSPFKIALKTGLILFTSCSQLRNAVHNGAAMFAQCRFRVSGGIVTAPEQVTWRRLQYCKTILRNLRRQRFQDSNWRLDPATAENV